MVGYDTEQASARCHRKTIPIIICIQSATSSVYYQVALKDGDTRNQSNLEIHRGTPARAPTSRTEDLATSMQMRTSSMLRWVLLMRERDEIWLHLS